MARGLARRSVLIGVVILIAILYFSHVFDGSISRHYADEEDAGLLHPEKYDVSELQSSAYDFIVVGGGQSGLVVANRLSEDRKNTVLVVEYGYLYRDDPKIARPWQPFDPDNNVYHDPKLLYNYTSTPQKALNNRRTPVEAGATVGGGSTVNGMFLNRGSAWDYDAWEKLGNEGWGWKGLLPYFKKSVTFTPPGLWLEKEYGAEYDIDSAYGAKGPIHASNPAWAWPGQKIQMEGWKEMGLKQSREGAGGDAFGIFWVPRAQDPITQTRSYSVSGHLDSAMKRKNFDLLVGHRVRRVLLSKSGNAEGIEMLRRDGNGTEPLVIRAKKEIIMCAGLHTPLILQRSGIGPRNVLEEAGIEVKVELPGVGMNFQDHPTSGLGFSYETDVELNPGKIGKDEEFTIAAQQEFEQNRTGPYAGGHNTVAFLTGADFLPDPQYFATSVAAQPVAAYLPATYASDPSLLAGYSAQRELLAAAFVERRASLVEVPIAADPYVLMILQKPLSRGTVTVDPRDALGGAPLVDFGTFANPLDLEVALAMARFARLWARTEAMRPLTPRENWPGEEAAQSDEQLAAHVRGMAESGIGHESGTCSMLPRELGGVVDAALRVYGVRGLSVADASVMPLVPSTNLCATVYAVAEKAADLIKERHSIWYERPLV